MPWGGALEYLYSGRGGGGGGGGRLTNEQLLEIITGGDGDGGGGGGGGADPASLAEQRYEADLMSQTRRYEADLAARIDQELSRRSADTDRYGSQVAAGASKYGSRLQYQASKYGADLDYQLGLKNLDVDWAEVGISRDRVDIERQLAAVQEGELAEVERSNRVTEAQRARGQALDAASNAVQAYMEGSRLADARRLSAFQETRQLLPYMVSEGQEYQAGFEPGGPLSGALGGLGLNLPSQRLPTTRLDPSQLAVAPTDTQIGSGLLAQIGQIQGAVA